MCLWSVSFMPGIMTTRLVCWAVLGTLAGFIAGCRAQNPAFLGVDANSSTSFDAGPLDVADAVVASVDTGVAADVAPESLPQHDLPMQADLLPVDVPLGVDVNVDVDGPAAGGDVAVADLRPPDVVAGDAPVLCNMPVIGNGAGLNADYFENSDLTGRRVSRVENIDWSFGTAAPPSTDFDDDNWSVRWSGQLQAMFSGPHTLFANYDDGMRIFLDGRVILYRWGVRLSESEDKALVHLEAGRKYDVLVELFEQGGAATAKLAWQSLCRSRQAIPRSQLHAGPPVAPSCLIEIPSGSGSGLRAEYFSDREMTRRVGTGGPSTVNFQWGDNSPAQGVPLDFSARFSGKVEAPIDGPLTFYLQTDDVGRLRFNGSTLIESWSEEFGPQEIAATVNVQAGKLYDIGIDMRDDKGGAVVSLAWSWPCRGRVVVPAHRLHP